MRKLCTVLSLASLLVAAPALSQGDAMGLYFALGDYSLETAVAQVVPGSYLTGYIVLTSTSGGVVNGFEVNISCTAADFSVLSPSVYLGTNQGSHTNLIVTFTEPRIAVPMGTMLELVSIRTASLDHEAISFGASSPASLPGGTPVVVYGDIGPVACSYPHGTPVVAWLNGQPVSSDDMTWGAVKSLFR
jgi:hypothetical protein